MAIARINGPMLQPNLERQGTNLAIVNWYANTTPTIYFDVVDNYVGINNNSPAYNLDVHGTTNITGSLTVGGISTFTGNMSAGNITVGGNINISGATNTITGNIGEFFGNAAGFGALYAGINSGYIYQPQTTIQSSANFNGYAQINNQNINPGPYASTDFVATADNGTATDTFIDVGINSSGFSGIANNQTLA